MATDSQAALARPVFKLAGRNGIVDQNFYFAMSLLIAGITFWGFSRTVDARLIHPVVPRPPILWVHAVAFSLWVLFFISQTALVRTHNVKLHRTLGWFGAGLGAFMIPLGVATAIVMTRFDVYRLHRPGRLAFLIVPLHDMVSFAILLALAIWWRRKPEMHRRLMLIATCVLLAAAFGRFPHLFQDRLTYVCVDALILLGVVRDLIVNRRIHKVYLVALPVMAAFQAFVIHTLNSSSPWWMRIAGRIVG